jgi:hypothetical protein
VALDVCKIYGSDTVFLQQAAHLTGGSYINVQQREALLQYLMVVKRLNDILPIADNLPCRQLFFPHPPFVG